MVSISTHDEWCISVLLALQCLTAGRLARGGDACHEHEIFLTLFYFVKSKHFLNIKREEAALAHLQN